MFLRKRNNTARLLSEYPWMWAVRSQWLSHAVIKVLEVGNFDRRLRDRNLGKDERLWAKLTYAPETSDFGEVRPITDVTYYRTIGENVSRCLQPDGKKLEYFVLHEGDDSNLMPYYIYRAAAGADLHKEVCSYLESARRNAVGA